MTYKLSECSRLVSLGSVRMFPRVYKTERKCGAGSTSSCPAAMRSVLTEEPPASALGTSSTGAHVPWVLERLRRGGLHEWVEGHG